MSNIIEISVERFEELIKEEERLNLVREIYEKDNYVSKEYMQVLLMIENKGER